jgi:ribosomal protein L11 methyltransferase
MNDFISISFTSLQPEQKDILIASLADAGFEGFEEKGDDLLAFIHENDFDEIVLKEIAFKYQLQYKVEKIETVNWNQVWESSYQPVVVDSFCIVRAAFHSPVEGFEHEIVITPKMSFGTGHHATTWMMIKMMQDIDFNKKMVLDFGTGTGILAILAEKLQAKEILAIDNDTWSIENAAENVLSNHCSKINVKEASSIPHQKKFDIILANINKHVILESLPSAVSQLSERGLILISGLLESDREEIIALTTSIGLTLKRELNRNSWICLLFAY